MYKHYTLKCYFYLFDIFCHYCKRNCFLILIFLGLFVACYFCTLSLYPGAKDWIWLLVLIMNFFGFSIYKDQSHLQIEIVSILPQGDWKWWLVLYFFLHIFSFVHPDLLVAYGLLDLRNMSNSSVAIYFSNSSFKISGEVQGFPLLKS